MTRAASDRSTWCRPPSSPTGRRSRRSGPSRWTSTRRRLKRRLAGRTAPIKLLLLDQRIVAGLGNIYVCEALYRAGIHPERAGGSISLDAAEAAGPGDPRCARRSHRGGRIDACATSRRPTASSAISRRASRSTTAKGSRATAAAPSSGSSRAAARPSTARTASVDLRGALRLGERHVGASLLGRAVFH